MTRIMYDAIHANINAIPSSAAMVAGYDTGSKAIQWTTADFARFPHATQVHIDQAFGAVPLTSPHKQTVQDVESGAYTIAAIQQWVANCTAPRPTTYVAGNNLPAALAASKADIWLAAPGISDDQAIGLMTAEPRIIAVQNQWSPGGVPIDRSIVGDAFWPNKKPAIVPVANLRSKVLAATYQVNMAWDASHGVAAYQWQVEELTSGGWVVVATHMTSNNFDTARNLAPGHNFRFRVSDGTWSAWVAFSTP